MHDPEERKKLLMSDGREQLALLTQVLQKDEAKLERENEANADDLEEDDD